MRGYRTNGVIIKRKNFGEADRILTIFTKHYGKISAIAKGVRKISSRRGGSLELFCLVKIYLVRGKNLDIVTEVEVEKSYFKLKSDLAKIARGFYICELIDRLTGERQENRQLYNLIADTLFFLDREKGNREKLDLIIREFEQAFLVELGYWPKDKSFGSLEPKKFIENILEAKIKSSRVLKLIN